MARCSTSLDERLLADLVESLKTPETVGITLHGSLARGGANRWSDIDLNRFVRSARLPDDVRHVGGRLARTITRTLESAWAELREPAGAIWAVPDLRGTRILFDPDHEIARLRDAAFAFRWDDAAAGAWVRRRIAEIAEYVLKLRPAIERRDESSALNATHALGVRVTDIVLVARGVMVSGENAYHRLAWDAGGAEWGGATARDVRPWRGGHRRARGARYRALRRHGRARQRRSRRARAPDRGAHARGGPLAGDALLREADQLGR